MEFSGLIARYPANRPLTQQERCHQLQQKLRLNVKPHCQLSVIKMNSTYLESVDKWFGWKGVLSGVMIVVLGMFSVLYAGFWHIALTRSPDAGGPSDDAFVLISGSVLIFPLLAFATGILRKESFAYTHYPIRFNRKSRTVHVFRTNGTVLSVPWDEVFFTLGHMPQWNEWEVRGHVLDADGDTVKETFALSYVGSLSALDTSSGCTEFSEHDFVRAHWEFIRSYMEDGPQAVSCRVEFCMPVDARHESLSAGVERIFANIATAPFVLYLVLFPLCLAISLFRFFAMRTSKVPEWPEDVDAECVVELGDPYAIEAAANGDRVAVYPEAAAAGGVQFRSGLGTCTDTNKQCECAPRGRRRILAVRNLKINNKKHNE